MKMNYRPIRNARSKSRLGLSIPLCFLGLLALFHFFYPALLGSLAARAASPFWKGEAFVSEKLHALLSFFAQKQALTEEVARLGKKLEGAERLLLDRDLLLEENKALKEQFGRTEERSIRLWGALLATPPRSPYDTVIIDIGTQGGVAAGDLALSGSSVLGVVGKAYAKTAIVELFSTAGRKTAVSIVHEGRGIPVEAVGEGAGSFMVTLPKEVSIAIGDAVTMPGYSLFLFARVESIESEVTDSFQDIRFKNPVPLQSLRFLEIEKAASPESTL